MMKKTSNSDKKKIRDDWYNKKGGKERAKENYRKRYDYVKKVVFEHYSNGIIHCICCGESDIRFLTIDHKDGRKKWNHKNSFSGLQLWAWLLRNGLPRGFQVMCYNCNCAKGVFNECPHQIDKPRTKSLIDEIHFLKEVLDG